MKLLYEGVDITDQVELSSGSYKESASGRHSSLQLVFSDSKHLWSKWKPKQNQSLQVISEEVDTGTMYLDRIASNNGSVTLKALPLKTACKTPKTAIYENISLILLGDQIANSLGLKFQAYEVENHIYKRLEQLNQTDLAFFYELAKLESMGLRVFNDKLILYSEPTFEKKNPLRYFDADDGLVIDYRNQSETAGFKICHRDMTAEFVLSGLQGSVLTREDVCFSDVVEGTRFAKGLLREKNKACSQVSVKPAKLGCLPAGSVANLEGYGLGDGSYLVEYREVNLLLGTSEALFSRVLEGY